MSEFPYTGVLEVVGGDVGTAFVCGTTRTLVTASHIVPSPTGRLVWHHLGKRVDLRPIILFRDEELDVCVIDPGHDLIHEDQLPLPPPRALYSHGERFIKAQFSGAFLHYGDDVYHVQAGYADIVPPTDFRYLVVVNSNVRNGCSGAPLVVSTCGGHMVIGMIVSREITPQYDKSSVWAVPPRALGRALLKADERTRGYENASSIVAKLRERRIAR